MMVQAVAICLLLLMWSVNLNVSRAPWPITPVYNHYNINVINIGLYWVSPLRDPLWASYLFKQICWDDGIVNV